jgi:hypothetical protein
MNFFYRKELICITFLLGFAWATCFIEFNLTVRLISFILGFIGWIIFVFWMERQTKKGEEAKYE